MLQQLILQGRAPLSRIPLDSRAPSMHIGSRAKPPRALRCGPLANIQVH